MDSNKSCEFDINKVKFGLLVQSHRREKGLSQDELGNIIGVTRKSISCIERGDCYPSPDNIFKLSQALDMSLDRFVFGYNRYSEDIDIEEINKMLQKLDSDKKVIVIAVINALCKAWVKEK